MNYAPLLGVEPDEAVRPTTVGEVAAVVARANASGKAVIPWGGGTGQDYGYLPRRPDIVLDLSGLSRIVAHEPGDMTVTVEAGATLAQVQAALATHSQFLPLDPPDADRATVGGILALNAWGPSRLGYGTARDWLIGLTVVDARGRIIRGGGRVVKNVTGYDLPKLHVGALGTLGVIVEATFKLAPVPEAFAEVSWEGVDANFVARLHAAALSPVQSVLKNNRVFQTDRGFTLCFAGPREVVEAARAEAERIAVAAGARAPSERGPVVVSGPGRRPRPQSTLRFSGPADGAYARHEAIARSADWAWVRTLPGTGHTDAGYVGEDAGEVAVKMIQWSKERDTAYAVLDAPSSLRGGDVDLWWPLPPAFALMKRMKETLDPDGTLNPGRFVGRL